MSPVNWIVGNNGTNLLYQISSDFVYHISCVSIYMTIDYTSAVRACAYVHNTRKFRGTKMLIMNYADNLTAKFRGREYSVRCADASWQQMSLFGTRVTQAIGMVETATNVGIMLRGDVDLFHYRAILRRITEYRAAAQLFVITKYRCDITVNCDALGDVTNKFVSDLTNIAGIQQEHMRTSVMFAGYRNARERLHI